MPRTNVRGTQIADGANGVDLAVDVTGTLPIAQGGTGRTTAGSSGDVLVSNGSALVGQNLNSTITTVVNARTPKIWGPLNASDATPSGAVAGDIILRRQ